MLGELRQALCVTHSPYHCYHLPVQQNHEDRQQSQSERCTVHFCGGECQEIYELHLPLLQCQP